MYYATLALDIARRFLFGPFSQSNNTTATTAALTTNT